MIINDFKGTLSGKVVLITGAGGGIGFETAKNCAAMGAKVILLDIDREKGDRAQKAIESIYPDQSEFYGIDLADENSLYRMRDYVLNKYGCPDVVFNNAAVLHLGEIGHVSSKEWDHGYLVNCKRLRIDVGV